ncbi:MAG: succinate--CoA ligase subunit alpha [Alphaproteobacteria bacterium]|nr:succinate--CoA ligase subunit alpha [Alphaproteobacteria bacterium]
MSILADHNTRVIIQGITGAQASFHTKRSLENGTKIVAGTSPGHGGEEHLGVPVFNNVYDAKRQFEIDASVLFVPATAVKNAVREAVEAEIPLLVPIAQGVPVHDMLEIKAMLNGSSTTLIGPNTPGLISPNEARLGIFPENIHKKGSIGIISLASTLTYEAVLETNEAECGQSTVIGLGDDMIVGTDYRPLLDAFEEDEETKAVVLIGNADGSYEQLVAEYYAQKQNKKPLIAYVAGASLSAELNIGYASDIITHGRVTVADKKKIMKDAGIIVADSMNQIHQILKEMKF